MMPIGLEGKIPLLNQFAAIKTEPYHMQIALGLQGFIQPCRATHNRGAGGMIGCVRWLC